MVIQGGAINRMDSQRQEQGVWPGLILPVPALGSRLSWGSNFELFNYFLFDYLPGYNKFRSVTFAMVIIFFSMPLLGMLGLEKLIQMGVNKELKQKLMIAFGLTGGLCFLFLLFGGMFSFSRPFESQLPVWFTRALHADRRAMMQSDAIRSVSFIFSIFILLYFNVQKKISSIIFFAFLSFMMLVDVAVVDRRYFTKDDYKRKRDNATISPWASNDEVMKDKENYRVLNLTNFYEANTSAFHHSLGGYHGVRIKRYQELFDSCISREQELLIDEAQQGKLDLKKFGVLNMLNTKYFIYGDKATDFIPNTETYGNAWFVKDVVQVGSPNEELVEIIKLHTKQVAVLDTSKFKVQRFGFDSLSQIKLVESKPPYLKYESQSSANSFVVFSEIFYPKGWHALIDGKETPILRVNYVLRALEVPSGSHVIEFKFEPRPYLIGDKVTMASSWVLILLVIGCLGWSFKNSKS